VENSAKVTVKNRVSSRFLVFQKCFMKTLTIEDIELGKSSRGAWSNAQLRALGVEQGFNFNKGWKVRLIGKQVTDRQYEKFLGLRDAHLKPQKDEDGYFLGTDKYCCETCFHGLDNNCESFKAGMLCGYWYNPNSEIQGIKYRKSLKEQSLPLFEQATA